MKDKEKIFKLLREAVETPQESFAVEEMISKIEKTIPPIEDVGDNLKKFAGYRFYRNKNGKFWCTISMHRFVWTYFNGEIPEGCDVHHIDRNPDNNNISNLQLLTKAEHNKLHAATKKKGKPDKKSTFTCAVCGREYEAVSRGNNTYCSAKCKKIAERERAAEIKVCEICGKEFKTSDKARFCSKKCLGEYLKKQETKTCPTCGKTFSALISQNQKYCSPECAAESYKKRETRVCLHCGKSFTAVVTRDRKFCSQECFHEYKRETKTCPICGKEFTAKPSRDRKYCSRACYHKARCKN